MTDKTQHTPGPWHAKNDLIMNKDNKVVADVLHETESKTGAEVRANKILIAAAPELLEALEKISNTPTIGDVRHCQKHKAHDDFIMIARTAIAKARGES